MLATVQLKRDINSVANKLLTEYVRHTLHVALKKKKEINDTFA